jgi:hypothetical protein
VKAMKIWAFSPASYSNDNPCMITVKDKNAISLTETIDWRYHVAMVLLVKTGEITEEWVIDLALFPKGPVYYRTWLAKFKTEKLLHLFADAHWYLFNSWYEYTTDFEPLEGEPIPYLFHEDPSIDLPNWFPKEVIYDFYKYELDCKENHWLEKGLAINATAYQFFMNEIYPKLENSYYSNLLYDYRMMVGDVFNFETIFRDFTYNDEMTEDFQYKYAAIIEKYRLFYDAELRNWKIKLQDIFTV